jgi:hypothetical protein
MREGERGFGLICLGLSLWLILEANKFDYRMRYMIVHPFFQKNRKEPKAKILPGWKTLLRVGLILLIFSGFILLMTTLGFALAVFVSVALILFVLEAYGMARSIIYGILYSGLFFLIFRYWMGVDLPKGWVGF